YRTVTGVQTCALPILLLSGKWRRHPEIVAALKVQTTLNGGAWPFDEVERALVAEPEGGPMAAAYFLVRAPNANPAMADTTDLVTIGSTSCRESGEYE